MKKKEKKITTSVLGERSRHIQLPINEDASNHTILESVVLHDKDSQLNDTLPMRPRPPIKVQHNEKGGNVVILK